ncbi:MAG: hypothetical protein JXC36_07965 [Candidatus Atribacteria bacterium]|nr:hypothetical protein [Candidatus Atribacteria bacterium]
MSILIITVGQRDVQYVKNNNCYSFDRFDLMKIQKQISENKILTKWQPYKNGANSINQHSDTIKYVTIVNLEEILVTFPLLEKILRKAKRDLSSHKLQNLEKILLYYTDRHELYDNCDDIQLKGFIRKEPWYFAKLFQKHYPEIREKYNLTDFPESIDLIKIDLNENDINRSSIIRFLDGDLRSKISCLKRNDPLSKAIVACSGGLPDVKNVIEEVCSLYFPDNCFFYDQDQKNDNIMHSVYHEYKKQAKERFELINSIKNWNFAAAYNICSSLVSFVNKNSDLYYLIELAHEWLSGDPQKAMSLCDKLFNIDTNNSELFRKMKIMLSKSENSSTRSIIRLMHLYRTRNYWGAATVLITAVENMCARFICNTIPQCCVNKYERFFFDKNTINNKYKGFNPPQKILNNNDPNLIVDNFLAYESIITFLSNNKKIEEQQTASVIKNNFLKGSDFYNFKFKRNEFIHNGESLQKQKLDNLLFADQGKILQPVYHDPFIGSPLIKQIVTISEQIDLDYVNWLPVISKKIVSEIENN